MIGAILAEAWRAMGANKLRTFLTMLGMIIGVGAVVIMLAIGEGAQMIMRQTIATMGSNLFVVLSSFTMTSGVRSGTGSTPTLTLNDANSLRELATVANVAPVQPGSAQVVYGSVNWNSQVYGVTPAYMDVRGWDLQSGDPITDADVRTANRVALLGQTVVNRLFGDEDPLGKTIRVRDAPFVVAGTLEPKGQSFDGRDQDDTVLVPLTTAQRKVFGSPFPNSVRMIMVQGVSDDLMPDTEQDITALLRERHRIQEGMEPDFMVRNMSAAADIQAQTTRVMSMLLGAVAAVSLVVGGIGIMNIMLVSVTERTREIGLRLAVGARRRDLLTQFLVEAIVLSGIGGLLGMGLGMATALIVARTNNWPVLITPQSILIAFAFSTGVGVFFGFYPAWRAARLDPIESLRRE